jgi:hypothetical protein
MGIPIVDEAARDKVPGALGRLSPGELLTVKVLRGGKVMELSSRIPAPDRR